MSKPYYVIMVDYFMWDAKNDREYKSPCYLFTTRDNIKLFTFNEKFEYPHHDLKWFSTRKEAEEYVKRQDVFKNSVSFDNVRIVEIKPE